MEIVRPATEEEVLECFVLAERDSERYGEAVRELLKQYPDDPAAVLAAHRSWPDEGLFLGFPPGVEWYRARVTKDELLEIRYINWDWWLRLTGGSRRPLDAAVGQEPDEGDRVIAQGASTNPPVIAVRAPGSYLVLLEGHVRLTAYATFPEYLPDELEIYLGESPRMAEWCQY